MSTTCSIGSRTFNPSQLSLNLAPSIENLEQYIIESNVSTIQEARVLVLLEAHRNTGMRCFNAQIIDEYHREGDLILTEYWASTPPKDILYTPQSFMKKKEVETQGWLCPKSKGIFDQFIQQMVEPLKQEHIHVLKQIEEVSYFDKKSIIQLMDYKGKIEIIHKQRLCEITDRIFSPNQDFLIKSINDWLEKNSSTSSRLYVIAGRDHGNRFIEKADFKNRDVERLIEALSKTTYIVIDQLGRSEK